MIFSDTFQPAEEGDYVCCLGSEPQSYQQEVALRFCTSSPEQNILRTFFIFFLFKPIMSLNTWIRWCANPRKSCFFFKFFAHIRRRGSVHSAGNFHIVSVPVWRAIKNLCPWVESKISKWSAYFVWMNVSSCSISGLCCKEENSWSCFQIIFVHQLSSNNCSPLSIWSWSSSLPSSTSWSSPEHQGQSWPGQQNPTHCQRSTCTLRSGAGLSWGTSTDRLSPGTRCILIRL